jgi:hypothetical protein
MTEAEHKRDADRSKAVNDAETKVKTAHADADKQQQTKVAGARTQIANHQATTLGKQEAEVGKLDKQSGEKKKGALGKINQRIQADQSKVDGDYDKAAKDAEDKKKKGDEEAARKKKGSPRVRVMVHCWACEHCRVPRSLRRSTGQARCARRLRRPWTASRRVAESLYGGPGRSGLAKWAV